MSSNTSCSLLSLLFLLLLLILDSADLTVSSYCLRNCGGIKIPYPFGIGMGCYLEHSYEIECVNSSSIPGKLVPFLSAIGKEVVNISSPQVITSSYVGLEDGSVRIKNKITSKGCSSDGEEHVSLLNLTGTPFYVGRNNILIASGCNNMASLTNVEPIMVGCKSSCSATNRTASKDYLAELSCDKFCSRTNETIFNQKGCNGFQCCEANMPTQIQQIVGVRIDSTTTTGGCKVAFLTDEEYSFLNGSDPKRLHAKGTSTVELGWFIHTSNRSYVDSLGCQSYETMSRLKREGYNAYESTFGISCFCDYNAYLSYARCSCNDGYQGNPYLQGGGGCKDVNECLEKDYDGNYKCMGGTCVDLQGHYECEYKKHRPLAIGFGSSFGSLIFIVGIYWLYKFMRKQKRLKQKKKFFKRNGGLLLQQQLTATEGNVEKTKVFTSRELEKATENFNLNRILGQGGQGTVYKGMLGDGRIVAVKKSKVVDEDKLEEFINEVVILSQINHRNIVKLLGCCLETDVPVLVYEFIPNGNLFEHLHDELEDYTMTTWEVRLRIAVDIAEALSYLHSAASSPIYHRDVKSTNIMLDEKYRAKVSDFGTSRSVTVDHTHLTTVVSGTVGYVDPEYFQSSQFTDKSDVYSFGVVLVELITGEKSISFLRSQENRTLATYFIFAMKHNTLFDIIDPRIRDGCKLNQVTAAAKIARKCLNLKGRKRPSMREVSMELEKIRSSSGDMQPDEYVSENEEEREEGVVEVNIKVESWNNVAVTAPTYQCNNAASSSLWSDVEPLFPLQTL
ncbi:wall-associated receptor kinase-like 10 [Arabidopsis lyrata subsp. lyrata]|uniref:wall-associated receptor kinase-like 10 n=1 Tax=Arabidopsis lyrata subsp. lyrata TaxID=81972 RepID=UPI000A29A2A0|nr:wall-associated receptor kinase-like 10 [Arabidopsis lyrata subsp. lyrata]|eukprot:XP_020886043.1 wall-associated receptor kinase-like 10 [Arabidopsis lyrata subsp. lyrata]